MSVIQALEGFDCEGDPSSVGSRWEKWKRAFQIFLEASNIESPRKKRATLLHTGGLSLQEIYYSIPGAHVVVDEKDETDAYTVAITKLDEYFAPKQSKIYERHLFRLMKQEPEEKFEKFLVRLRNQVGKCKFLNVEENLIDQIAEKCSSAELRKKILTAGDTVTLDTIITEANALETINRQLEEFSSKKNDTQPVNKIEMRNKKPKTNSCTRCGSDRHTREYEKCPAKDKKCLKCGYVGHFRACCKTSTKKRKSQYGNIPEHPAKKNKQNHRTKQEGEEVDYVFHIDDDALIDCIIGGVSVEMLIDSGCKSNLLKETTWEEMKKSKVTAFNQIKNPDKTFMAYGSKEPLKLIGSFESSIAIGNNKEKATFYVVKDGSKNLLGKSTAMALGVLQLGCNVNAIGAFPKFKDILVDIPIDETIKPVCQPYRRIPIPLEAKVNRKLQELVEADIIEEVNEPCRWISAIVPILKENQEVRICTDMRCANAAIIRENHPLPTMDQFLPKFRNARFFSKLDIKDAFHQVEIHPDSRYITTFITSKGLYRYKRLSFGISCAPEIFQKTLERKLISCEGTVNFIDDILIYGADEAEHDKRLEHTLKVLKENNILLNTNKCVYKVPRVKFLGHELSQNGVKPLPKYIDAVQRFRTPETTEEIQSFLGLVNFVGKWIPNLATLTEPLRRLLRMNLGKQTNIEKLWKCEQDSAFQELKNALSKVRSLGYYNPQDRTQVIADASPVGLGAILIQHNPKGPRIIAYGNKSLTDCEKRYCQTEKEALALVWAVEHFNIYLYGKNGFELISDHKPLEVIFGPKSKPCARIERWVLRLQAYKYKVIYRPGKSNIADPLSRLCKGTSGNLFDDETHINRIVEYSRPVAVSLQEIKKHSEEDEEITKTREGIFHNNWDSLVNNYKIFETELCFHEGILLRRNKIVIPLKLRQRVLEAAHEGHPGIVAMKTRLRTKVWWPKIDKDAEKMVKACKGYTLVSAPNPPVPMKRRELPVEPWIDVAIDYLGPLPSGDHLLVIVDYYSRYKEIKAMKTITASETIKVLKEIFSRLGFPVTLTSDNAKQLTGREFEDYCEENGITPYNTIPYWPQQNGEVERQNRDILKRLKISQIEKKDWKQELLTYLMMYNSTPHSVTGKTPSELFYRRQFRDKIPSVTDIENRADDSEVRDRDKDRKEKGKQYSDRKRKAVDSEIEKGDKVYVKNMTKENKLSSNFNPTTHTVVDTRGGDMQVQNDETGQQYRRNVIHLKKVEGEWTVQNENVD